MPSSWRFRATGNARERPSSPRATTTDSSTLEVELRLGQQRTSRPGARGARAPGVDLGGVGDPELAPAVVAAGGGLEPERAARASAAAACSVVRRRTSRHGATRPRPPRTNRRSASRSWVTPQRQRPGPHRRRRHRRRRRPRPRRARARRSRRRSRTARRRAAPTSSYAPTTMPVGDGRGRAGRVRIQDDDAVAHRPRRERQHPARAGRRPGSRSSPAARSMAGSQRECRLPPMRQVIGRRVTDVDVG